LTERTEQQAQEAARQHRVNLLLGGVAVTASAAAVFALDAAWKMWVAFILLFAALGSSTSSAPATATRRSRR
jgi:hypothetical protein